MASSGLRTPHITKPILGSQPNTNHQLDQLAPLKLKTLTVLPRRLSGQPKVREADTAVKTAVAAALAQENKEVRHTVVAAVQVKPVGAVQPSQGRPTSALGAAPIEMLTLNVLVKAPGSGALVRG